MNSLAPMEEAREALYRSLEQDSAGLDELAPMEEARAGRPSSDS